MAYYSQSDYAVRMEWGDHAITHLASDVECVVVVDVMSFSTCVSIATDQGAAIYPYPWRDETALAYGRERDAAVASSKRRFEGGYSLSPSSLLALPANMKLVLPSPNGSAIAYRAKDVCANVLCGSLRNMAATSSACRAFSSVLIVPCGERWPDGSLRPALEDYVAAGGIAAAIGGESLSPEAWAAAMAFEQMGLGRAEALRRCGSARELIERGFEADVALCLQEDVSRFACRLDGDCFRRTEPDALH